MEELYTCTELSLVLIQTDWNRMCWNGYIKTDEIFESEDLNCIDRLSVRVYADKGRKQDYGRFWAAIFALKESSELADNLKECIWYNGAEKENLLTEFLRN